MGVLAVVVLVWSTIPRNRPDEARAKRDFLAENPSVSLARVDFEDHEVGFVAYRVFYRRPGDPNLHSEVLPYFHSLDPVDDWRILRDPASQ